MRGRRAANAVVSPFRTNDRRRLINRNRVKPCVAGRHRCRRGRPGRSANPSIHPALHHPTYQKQHTMTATYDADKVKAEMMDKAQETDDFQDAVEDEDDEGIVGDFTVTADEISILRAAIASDYPEDGTYLSEAYIRSVANKPYSKDPTIRRPLEYSQEKLLNVMKWRDENFAPTMESLVALACEDSSSAAAIEDPDKYNMAVAMVKSLNNASIYFHGFTKEGRPILWVRTNRKPWYPDVDAECNALILIADAGIKAMPDDVTDFVVVAESSYPPPPNPTFMIKLLQALVCGYPDRLKILYSAPVSSIVQFVMNLLLPLMPGRLASKVCLLTTTDVQENLKKIMDEEDIPDFFGGPAQHDALYPEEGKSTVKKGYLKFDYDGMVERLQAAKDKYMKSKAT
jgi:hypothetical protein